jgi:hypothetical protein
MRLIRRSPDRAYGSICGAVHKKAFTTSFELTNSHIAAGSTRGQMTFATLRALQAIIGDAIDEIYAAYASQSRPCSSSLNSNFASPSPSSSSPPPSPSKQHRSPTPPLLSLSNHTLSSASHYSSSNTPIHSSDHDAILDFPDLNFPGDPSSPAEQLTSRPDLANAISRIVAAASQLAIVVRSPFLTICDATMIVRPTFPNIFSFTPRLLGPIQVPPPLVPTLLRGISHPRIAKRCWAFRFICYRNIRQRRRRLCKN